MENSTYEKVFFAPANNQVTTSVCTAMCIGTALFDAGYLLAKLLGEKPDPHRLVNEIQISDDLA